MKRVKFYHSLICPRCHASNLLLARALRQHPGIEITRIEFLANLAQARTDGVTSVPTLVDENGRRLSGVVLTPARIRQFLDALDADT